MAGWVVGMMARLCIARNLPSSYLGSYQYLEEGRRMLLALRFAAVLLVRRAHMGRAGGFPREKDPQHRAPQLSRQAPNQL